MSKPSTSSCILQSEVTTTPNNHYQQGYNYIPQQPKSNENMNYMTKLNDKFNQIDEQFSLYIFLKIPIEN